MATLPLQPPAPLPGSLPRPSEAAKQHRLPRRPRWWRGAALSAAVILAIAAGAGWLWRTYTRPITVQVAPVAAHVAERVFGLGTIGADVQSAVGFKVAGVINEIDANEGDHVKFGQILARLDARDVEAQIAEARAGVLQAKAAVDKAQGDVLAAQANVTNARAMAGRRQALVKEGFASVEETQTNVTAMQVASANLTVARSEVGTAQAGLAAALAQEDFQKATLANSTLRAPYDAWVTARSLNLGAMPVPGQGVFTLAEPRTIWAVGYVDERLAGRLRVGQEAEIALRSEPAHRFPGHVARIEIQSDAINEERLVDVAFDTLPPNIHLAEQAEVYITTGVLTRAMTVPQSAVTGLANGQGTVWTVEDGRLCQRKVSFGPELPDGGMPVVAGLPEGAKVVVAPTSGLRIGRMAKVASGPPP
ncbi:MAG: efflux RND transporter periplasmic adaptor subunit [Proteobacteria bacterium]|nr:efflux RND transporter periplasmic adaptor subunit [Pseudomonadota bacterium]